MSRPRTSLRDDQLAATRERILDAASHEMSPQAMSALSFATVAERAGVSERTVFRHFPTMQALQEALVARYERLAGWPSEGTLTGDEIPAAIRRAFAVFGQYAGALNAEAEAANESRRRRRQAIAEALRPLTGELPPARAQAVAALFHTLVSIDTFRRMTRQWELSPRAAGDAAAWAAEVLLRELAHERRAGATARKPRRG